MTTVTFLLDQNNELVAIDNSTGFPQSIPLTIDGLKKVQSILHKTDENMRKEYYKRWNMEHAMDEERKENLKAIAKQRQIDELGELF